MPEYPRSQASGRQHLLSRKQNSTENPGQLLDLSSHPPQKQEYVKLFFHILSLLYHSIFQLLFPLSTASPLLYIEFELFGREDLINAIRHHDLY